MIPLQPDENMRFCASTASTYPNTLVAALVKSDQSEPATEFLLELLKIIGTWIPGASNYFPLMILQQLSDQLESDSARSASYEVGAHCNVRLFVGMFL